MVGLNRVFTKVMLTFCVDHYCQTHVRAVERIWGCKEFSLIGRYWYTGW